MPYICCESCAILVETSPTIDNVTEQREIYLVRFPHVADTVRESYFLSIYIYIYTYNVKLHEIFNGDARKGSSIVEQFYNFCAVKTSISRQGNICIRSNEIWIVSLEATF